MSGTQQNVGQLILQLGLGDSIALRNHTSITSLTLSAAIDGMLPSINASLTAERVG